jgi:hypothetical protein
MHTPCITNQARKMSLEIFYEKVTQILLTSDGTEIQVLGQTSSPAGRLVGRDHSVYSIPATHVKLEGKSQFSFLVSAEKQVPYQENCEEKHYNVLPKMLCTTLRMAIF